MNSRFSNGAYVLQNEALLRPHVAKPLWDAKLGKDYFYPFPLCPRLILFCVHYGHRRSGKFKGILRKDGGISLALTPC